MNKSYHHRIKEILANALEIKDGTDRSAYLDEACQGNSELRSQVESLLQAHDGAGDFLGRSVLGDDIDPFTEAPGTVVGPYEIIKKLGEGGFGVVYLADQKEPVRRKVALKIIKLGMDTKEVIARFEAERQALALLDHPNIAHVYDAGVTDRGRSYFSMEVATGETITHFCDHHRLTILQRLELFLLVCDGVQHAHQRGIIHRDLKPSNIVVTQLDGKPVPKIIDFGIAKSTHMRLTVQTLLTRHDLLVGTPSYMSPEQVATGGPDVDTRSDIYSMGVLLYELLAGSAPLEQETLKKVALDEVRRMIREQDPPKPSARLRRAQAGTRSTESDTSPGKGTQWNASLPPSLLTSRPSSLPQDLDWIVMKALEKDPDRRYATVHDLAQDLQRHLTDEPVIARPPSAAYKIQKAWRRNKVVCTAGLVVTLSLVLGLIGTSVGLYRTEKAREKAEVSEVRAHKLTLESWQNQYVSDLRLSYRILNEGNLKGAEAILENYASPPADLPDIRSVEWGFLWRLSQGDATSTYAQEYPLNSVTISTDGQWVATSSSQGIKNWGGGINRGLFGERLSMDTAGEIIVYAANSRERIVSLGRDRFPPTVVCFAPKNQALVAGYADGSVSIWSGEGFQTREILDGRHTHPVKSITFSSDGEHFATAGLDSKVLVWQLDDPRIPPEEFKTEMRQVYDLCFSPLGRTLGICGRSNKIELVNLSNHTKELIPVPGGSDITSLDFSQVNDLIAVGCSAGNIYVVDRSTGDQYSLGKIKRAVLDVRFLPDGKTLASAGQDQVIRLWDLEYRKSKGILRGHKGFVRQIAISADGKTIYSASNDQTLREWASSMPDKADVLRGSGQWVHSIAYSPDGKYLVSGMWVSEASDSSIRQWDVSARAEVAAESMFTDSLRVMAVVFLPQKSIAAVASDTGKIGVWDADQKKIRRVFQGHSSQIRGMAMSPDGKFLASATGNFELERPGELKLWTADTFEQFGEPVLVNDVGILTLAFSPDGHVLAIGGIDGLVSLWSVPSCEPLGVLPYHHELGALSVAFSNDGRLLATGGLDSLIILWDRESRRRLDVVDSPSGFVNSLVFTPGDRTLIAGNWGDSEINLWNVQTRRALFTLEGHDGFVTQVALSPDGATLASCSGDGTIRMWPSLRYPPKSEP